MLIEQPPVSIDPRYCRAGVRLQGLAHGLRAAGVDGHAIDSSPRWSWPSRSCPSATTGRSRCATPASPTASRSPPTTSPTPSRRCAIPRPAAPPRASAAASKDAGFERFEIHDAKHMTAHLSHPHAPFITDLDIGILERPPAGHAQGRHAARRRRLRLRGAARRDLDPRAPTPTTSAGAQGEAAASSRPSATTTRACWRWSAARAI